METARTGSKGQITVPKRVRVKLAVGPDDRLVFEFDEHGRLQVMPVPAVPPPLRGFLVEAILLPDIVLCEVEWVLPSAYDLSRATIAQTLGRLLHGPEFTFANRVVVNEALHRYERGKAEFSDYLVGAEATAARATTTFTFARDLRSSDDFTLASS